MQDYIKQAVQTKSDQFHGELVDLAVFENVLNNCIASLQSLDKIKKALFYGKKSDSFFNLSGNTCDEIYSPNVGEETTEGIGIIHAIIGKATEAGELLEALNKSIFQNEKFDVTNFKEEIGDGMWYDAIGLNAIGATIEEVQATNIAKLRARFPNKFTEFDANNRDLFAERQILESNVK